MPDESFPASDAPAIAARGTAIHPGLKTVPFQSARILLDLDVAFENVCARLAEAMGEMTTAAVNEIAAAAHSPDAFRAAIEPHLGPSGFTRFAVIDHGAWIGIFGHTGRLERWILGNPLIAETLIAHDRTSGLFAPIELLIDERGPTRTRITAVLPSTLIAVGPASAELKRIAEALDDRLRALIALAGRG